MKTIKLNCYKLGEEIYVKFYDEIIKGKITAVHYVNYGDGFHYRYDIKTNINLINNMTMEEGRFTKEPEKAIDVMDDEKIKKAIDKDIPRMSIEVPYYDVGEKIQFPDKKGNVFLEKPVVNYGIKITFVYKTEDLNILKYYYVKVNDKEVLIRENKIINQNEKQTIKNINENSLELN